jgi:polysaccharide biosynthesis protein PslL
MTYTNELTGLIIKKLDSYLKPYFVVLFLTGIYIMLSKNINLIKYFVMILYGGSSKSLPRWWLPLWFLPHLFAVSLFSYLCYRYTNLGSKPVLFKATFLVIILTIGCLGIHIFWNTPLPGTHLTLPGLPFSMDLILVSSFYFLLGSFLKQYILNLNFNWFMFIFSILTFSFLHLQYDITMDLNLRRYDNIFISTIEALIGIYLVISISIILQRRLLFSKLLSYIGSASIFILIFHHFIQKKSFGTLNSLIGNQYIINAFFSFILAVLVPILFYELAKRNGVLKILFMPMKSK